MTPSCLNHVRVLRPSGPRTLFALLLATSLAVFVPTTRAQPSSGTVSGTVVDAATGKFLQGAEVAIDGTGLSTVTARQGAFSVSNVPTGPHNVTVSYPGLEPKSTSVTVAAGQTSSVPVRLSAAEVITLSEFKVAGTKEGMAQAIALQKSADNTKVIAAGDQYGDIAEGNAAEYIKFLPGVGIDYNANDARAATLRGMSTAFTNVTMNGNPLASATSGAANRRFEFEQVAINNVETIEVFKTLTPEMQATSTGGSINLVTKSAFDRQGSLGTYRTYIQATGDDLTFNKTEGWGQEKTRKLLPGVDVNYASRVRENLGYNIGYKNSQLFNDYPRSTYSWQYNPASGGLPGNPWISSWNLQNEQKDTRRQSLTGQVDYKLGDNTKFSLNAGWNFYDLLFTDRVITVTPGNRPALSTSSTVAYGQDGNYNGVAGAGNYTLGTINRWKSGVTWNAGLNFTHDFDSGAKLEGSVFWSQAYSKYRDITGSWYSNATMQRTGLTVNFSRVGEVAPRYTLLDSTGAAIDLNDTGKMTMTQIQSRPQTGVDTRDGLSLDFKDPLKTAIPVTVKVGGRIDYTTRNIENHTYTKSTFTPAVTGTQLAGLVDTNFSNHGIGYGLPAYNFISLYSAYTQLGGIGYLPWVPASDTVARFDDTTNSSYVRLDVKPVEKLLFVLGARYEDRTTDIQNRQSALPRIVPGKFSDKSWFPSLNAKYEVNKNLLFRFGAAKSIGLPDYSDLLPGLPTVTEPTSSARGKVSIFNPTLKAYSVQNFDLSAEYYFNRSGFVSASLFRKTFKNVIFSATQTLDASTAASLGIAQSQLGSPFDQYDVTTPYNIPDSAHYNGLELGFQQNLTFLPKPFNTIVLTANGTFLSVDPIKSNAVLSNSTTDPNLNAALLQGVNKGLEIAAVKQSFNVSLNYSIGKLGFTVTSNYTGKVLKAANRLTVKYSDVSVNRYDFEYAYQAPRELIDLRIDYKWSRKFTPYFQARNVFARPIVMSSQSRPINHAEYGDPIFELGARGSW